MSNPIDQNLKTGTIGELLVQLRLLQYDVQASAPLKDSGNGLIAIKGDIFRTVQVRTSTTGEFKKPDSEKLYNILAVVDLAGHDNYLALDKSRIYLIPKKTVSDISVKIKNLDEFLLTEDTVQNLFS